MGNQECWRRWRRYIKGVISWLWFGGWEEPVNQISFPSLLTPENGSWACPREVSGRGTGSDCWIFFKMAIKFTNDINKKYTCNAPLSFLLSKRKGAGDCQSLKTVVFCWKKVSFREDFDSNWVISFIGILWQFFVTSLLREFQVLSTFQKTCTNSVFLGKTLHILTAC